MEGERISWFGGMEGVEKIMLWGHGGRGV